MWRRRNAENDLWEASMKQQATVPQQKPPRGPAPSLEDVKTQKQKAETVEVVGRHKNDGQKGHKGAR